MENTAEYSLERELGLTIPLGATSNECLKTRKVVLVDQIKVNATPIIH